MKHVGMHSPINKTAGAKADAGAAPGQSRRRKHDKPSKLRNLRGRKYIKRLGHLIHTLRHTHPHPNRQVDFDDVVTILLLGFYNADIRSLRKLELYSQVPGVGENLRVERICRSTLSEGLKLFDPALLAPLMEQLYKELPNRHCLNPEFQDLYEKLIAFDGSYFRVPAQVHWALRERNSQQVPGRQVRLNLHYCVGTGNPVGLSISGEGGASEAEALREIIEPGMIIVADRGTFSFAGVNDIAAGGGHFVFRLKAEVGFTSVSAKSLTDQDRQHRVISDRIGHLTGSPSRTPPLIQVREILIENLENPDEPIRVLTDRLYLSAHIIGLIYLQRWTIEIFFRWLKAYAHFEHMISHSPRGAETWLYVAMIGTLLMSLYTGHEPSTYAFTAMRLMISGEAEYQDLAPALARMARERLLARERRAHQRTTKTLG